MLIGLLLTAAILAYIFVGYPIVIRMLSRNRYLSTEHFSESPHITAVFVAYNEQHIVAKKIQNILSQNYPADKLNLIVVDDASTDSTADVIKALDSDRVHYLRMTARGGKAAGLNAAFQHITSDLVLLLDARQEIEPDATRFLSEWFTDAKVGAVSGELILRTMTENGYASGIDGYWKYEKAIRKAEATFASVPGVSGAIYMMRRACYRPIADDTVLDDVLIPMQCSAQGYRVLFDERAIAWDVPSADPVREKLRKIRTIRGNWQLLFRHFSWCLPGGHPIWWQFLSHKILRITAPFFAALHFLCAVGLAMDAHRWALLYAFLLIGIVSIYPLSLRFPNIVRGKLLRLLSAFIALNWYNVLGFYSYFFTQQSAAWKK